jgi:DDE family transposase
MQRVWYRHNQEGVVDALRHGRRPDMATTMASGPLDELVALHLQLGIFDALDALEVSRSRHGIDDGLLLRTLAVLPFLEAASLEGATGQLFSEPAVLLHLGWSPLQITWGDNERHRQGSHRLAESLPCHPDTLRDELRRVATASWERAQRTGVGSLYQRRLVRGRIYAIDGTGLNDDLRLVCLVCVSAERPVIVAWRLLSGSASEKGKEAAVTRSLIEQAVELGGPGTIELLLADALYADGPLLAWLKYQQGIDVLVPVPEDRKIHEDLMGLAAGGLLKFRRHSYVRNVQGHKQRRSLEIAAQDGLTSWDSFLDAAHGYGAEHPQLWGCLIRETEPDATGRQACWTLVSTRAWPSGVAGFEGFRPRWHIENDAYRELKEGWQLEAQRWGRDFATQQGRVTLTCLAFNTAQVYLGRSGQRLAVQGIRRLRRNYEPRLGRSPVVIYIGHDYAVLPVEELLQALGVAAYQSLRPFAASGPPP